jgi:hypothetical protein
MTPREALIPANNLQHKVLAISERDPQTSLLALAEQYFRTWALEFMSAFGILWRGRAVQGGGRSAQRVVQPVLTARTWATGAHLPGYQRLWSPV